MKHDMEYLNETDWITKYAVEVLLTEPANFKMINEGLTRMGIANQRDKVLTQTCHLLFKSKLYYITHFKEMLALEGKPVNIDPEDILRRNRIISLFRKWGMITVVNEDRIEHQASPASFHIIPHNEKHLWELNQKYKVGTR
jgi:hypothetical protein